MVLQRGTDTLPDGNKGQAATIQRNKSRAANGRGQGTELRDGHSEQRSHRFRQHPLQPRRERKGAIAPQGRGPHVHRNRQKTRPEFDGCGKPMAKVDGAYRAGKAGTGTTLRFSCGFCGKRFRAHRQRTEHTKFCRK